MPYAKLQRIIRIS